MGSWIGHIAPGLFFILFAFWWHINNCTRYLRSLANGTDEKTKHTEIKFKGSTTYPCFCLPAKGGRRLPIESILKVLITSIHLSFEINGSYESKPTPHFVVETIHHTAMLFGFLLGSWVEILVHYKVPLPTRITQVMGVLAFAMEAIMMIFHLEARSIVDIHLHQLLALTITCSMIGAIGECFDPNNFWFIIARSFFALQQGTWFLQIAFVIWPQTTNPFFVWDMGAHRSVSLLTTCYTYQLAGNAFLLIITYLLVYMFVSSSMKRNNNRIDDDKNVEYKLITNMNDEDNGL